MADSETEFEPVAFRVEADTGPDRVVLSVSGDLDLGGAAALSAALGAAMVSGAGEIVVDAAGLTFVDAVGARPLAKARARLVPAGRRFAIRSAPPAIERILVLLGLGDVVGEA